MKRATGLPAANLFAAVLMLSQFLLMLLIMISKSWLETTFPVLLSITGLLVVNEVAAVLIPTLVFTRFFCRSRGESISAFLRLTPLSGGNIILIVLMGLSIQPAMGLLSALSQLVFSNEAENTLASLLFDIPYLHMVAAVAAIPALFEELALRGAILGAYGSELDTRRIVLINGIFFGLVHLNPQQFLYTFALGALFAFFVIRTGSLFAGIVAHFTVNFTQVTLMSVLQRLYESFSVFEEAELNIEIGAASEDPIVMWSGIILGIVMFLAIASVSSLAFYLLLQRFLRLNPKREETDKPDQSYGFRELYETSLGAGLTDSAEEGVPLPEIGELKYALESKPYFTRSFLLTFGAAIVIYLLYIYFSGYTLFQIFILFGIFAAFFFVLFLFRIRR